jgi:V8-like Glu-specific endopeptidase
MGFDRASYGSVVLSQIQSAGSDLQLELSIGNYENEPIINYSPGSVFAQIGRSVGRLDVLTDKGVFPCTAFIVSEKHILTNYHCSKGLLDNEKIGASRIDATQFVAGYTQTGIDEGTKKYTVIPTPIEASKTLDYAVLEVIGDPSQEFGKLKLASVSPTGGDPFWIIGHPMGEGQRISREKCKANNPALSAGKLLHTCDTLPGNSGSPVIDAGLQQVVALHHAGSKADSVNFAILMSEILANSKVLTVYEAPISMQQVTPKTSELTACDALYSAATEAKACFAYEAYLKSCESHALAPIAERYIEKFCQGQGLSEVNEPTKEPATIAEICSPDNAQNCSDAMLCDRALMFGSGTAVYSNLGLKKLYVDEAKSRGLTCGTEVVYRVGVTRSTVLVRELDPASNSYAEVARFTPAEEPAPPAYSRVIEQADTRIRVAIAEGTTSWQVVEALKSVDILTGDIAQVPDEGYLAPDSYEIKVGDTREDVLGRMQQAQKRRLAQVWAQRSDTTPVQTMGDLLTLASIIEKETGVADERFTVASVFANRLEKGMPLQTDPTVIYGVTQGKGPLGRGLRKSELRKDTPWNTYVNRGLPPTPIANPGLASLQAALTPAATDFIFFVADGIGGHAFAVTLKEHNRNVAAWRAIEAARQPTKKNSCVGNPKKCKDDQLCRLGTIGLAKNVRWSEEGQDYAIEAKRRGLTCGVKAQVKKTCTASTPEVCTSTTLCYYAANQSTDEWVVSYKLQGYVKEAKKRGLTCGVGQANTLNFKQAFVSQPKLKRQQLQYALKKLGYYSYGVDGLWGKGTASGFDKFINGNGLKGKTEAQVFKNLLSRIKAPSSFGCQVEKKICDFSNTYLCSRATGENAERKYWIGNTYAESYIKEAKRRGLSCGVGSKVQKKGPVKEKTQTPSQGANVSPNDDGDAGLAIKLGICAAGLASGQPWLCL